MTLTPEQREKILKRFPKPRKKPVVENDTFLDAIIYIAQNGCTWRALPAVFGPWHTIYVRINRWAKNGLLERIFLALLDEQMPVTNLTVLSLDSSSVKVHPDAAGALQKRPASHRDEPGRA